MRERISRLKQRALTQTSFSGWIDLERIKYKQILEGKNAGYSMVRANILSAMLRDMPISLESEQLFAGSIDSCFAMTYDLYTGLGENTLNAAAPQDIKACWRTDPYEIESSRQLSPLSRQVQEETVCIGKRVTGHSIPDFTKVLRFGLKGIMAEVCAKITQLSNMKSQDVQDSIELYNSMLKSLRAAIHYSKRYRDEALRLYQITKDAYRREELKKLAGVCDKVPEYPAETFYEALQSIWLVYTCITIEQTPNPYAFSIGRLDQILYPYYEQDILSGRITEEDAEELLQAFWLKFVVGRACWAVSQNILLGGLRPDGQDGTNALSYLMLKCTKDLQVPQPSVAAEKIPVPLYSVL